MDVLQALLGSWQGKGTGEFPTIEPFAYDERLVYTWATPASVMHYVQSTTDAITGEPVHAESGYLHRLEDGRIELWNAQSSARVEVLRGADEQLPDGGWQLDLVSTHYGNDERMLASRRLITVRAHELVYTLDMHTSTTDEARLHRHLEARLERIT
jgi:hypothetical protein